MRLILLAWLACVLCIHAKEEVDYGKPTKVNDTYLVLTLATGKGGGPGPLAAGDYQLLIDGSKVEISGKDLPKPIKLSMERCGKTNDIVKFLAKGSWQTKVEKKSKSYNLSLDASLSGGNLTGKLEFDAGKGDDGKAVKTSMTATGKPAAAAAK
jgi:hypothetical protein